MKIQNINKAQQVRKVEATKAETPEAAERSAKDVVNVRTSEELTSIAMAKEPEEVDFAALKAAIQSGEYEPNLDRLVDRMVTDPSTMEDLLRD